MQKRKSRAWARLLYMPSEQRTQGRVSLVLWTATPPVRDLVEADLFDQNGLFQDIFEDKQRCLGSVLYVDRLPVSHAMIVDTGNEDMNHNPCHGISLGLIGAYTAADYRGLGASQVCITALNQRLTAGLRPLRRSAPLEPIQLTAEPGFTLKVQKAFDLYIAVRPEAMAGQQLSVCGKNARRRWVEIDREAPAYENGEDATDRAMRVFTEHFPS